jgi:hypothetical protein
MDPYVRKIAIDTSVKFGFCPIFVSADSSYIVPMPDAVALLDKARATMQAKIEELSPKGQEPHRKTEELITRDLFPEDFVRLNKEGWILRDQITRRDLETGEPYTATRFERKITR